MEKILGNHTEIFQEYMKFQIDNDISRIEKKIIENLNWNIDCCMHLINMEIQLKANKLRNENRQFKI